VEGSEFESEDQFRLAASELAGMVAAEALRLRAAFPGITAVADLLAAQVSDSADPHRLYEAAAAAYLAGRSNEAVRLLTRLSMRDAEDYPGAEWLHELRRSGGQLAAIAGNDDRLLDVLAAQVDR
jgi:hypothetical protein